MASESLKNNTEHSMEVASRPFESLPFCAHWWRVH
jgi:hypothetical protein